VYPPEGMAQLVSRVKVLWSSQELSLEEDTATTEGSWQLTVGVGALASANSSSLNLNATLQDSDTGQVVARIGRTVQVDTPPACAAPDNGCLWVRSLNYFFVIVFPFAPSHSVQSMRRCLVNQGL
jgi:hypothetical protein